jgi:hypothetical protein
VFAHLYFISLAEQTAVISLCPILLASTDRAIWQGQKEEFGNSELSRNAAVTRQSRKRLYRYTIAPAPLGIEPQSEYIHSQTRSIHTQVEA